MKKVNIKSIKIEEIDMVDFPKFCDAFIAYAEFEDGTELTGLELEYYQDANPDLVNELIHENQLYLV